MGLYCQPANLTPEENFDQAIRVIISVEIDLSSEGTTRITTIDIMTRERDHHTSQTEVSLGIGAVTKTTHDRPQRRDKTHPSRISAGKSDQTHLILKCLTDLEIKIRRKISFTTRNSQSPILSIRQT